MDSNDYQTRRNWGSAGPSPDYTCSSRIWSLTGEKREHARDRNLLFEATPCIFEFCRVSQTLHTKEAMVKVQSFSESPSRAKTLRLKYSATNLDQNCFLAYLAFSSPDLQTPVASASYTESDTLLDGHLSFPFLTESPF